jgi:hypothetical protein
MTYENRTPDASGQPQPPSHWPPMPQTEQPPPASGKKKRRLWPILFAAVGLFVLIATIIGITLGAQSGTPRTSTPTGYSAEDQQRQLDETPAAEPTTEPAAPAATPRVKDIALRAKITEKKCYGSGVGCNVGFNIAAEYVGPALNPDDTWLVTYEVTGIEDGPLIGSLEMTGDQYTSNPEYVGTKSSKSKIIIKVTSVEKVGI